MSNSKFGSAKEYWGYYYENRWVLRDVPDISESNDKKEQTHYNEFLEKNTKKTGKCTFILHHIIDEMSCEILRLMHSDILLLLHRTQYRCVQGTKSLKK
jgi:hypothetical protein